MKPELRQVPTGAQLEGISEVVALLKTADAKEHGVEEAVFHRNGLASIHAVATGLRARGYEVEVFGPRGGQRLRLLSTPGVGARRRKRDQTSLFDLPPRSEARGTYGRGQ